jgi:hypothetical protein
MATPSKSIGRRMHSWFTARQQPVRRQEKQLTVAALVVAAVLAAAFVGSLVSGITSLWPVLLLLLLVAAGSAVSLRRSPSRSPDCRPQFDVLEDRTLPSITPAIGDVFYIEMENHNLTQPSSVTSPAQLLNSPAAPYLNSLMIPGNPNAAQTSFASNYFNADYNNPNAPPTGIHPSEPNYVWQEAGLTGPLNDADPFPNNIVNAPNLSALLQGAGIAWKSYQEDIDLTPNSGTVNQPGPGSLTSAVAPQSQWTVPLKSFSGTSPAYTNPYDNSHQYNFAPKHDGQLFFTATNGGNDFSHSNPEAQYYAPLQQLPTDLNNNTVTRHNVITPDQFNDMHSALSGGFNYNGTHFTGDQASIAQGDNFLSIIVPQIMASQAYQNNGAIVIWFDETEGGNTTQFTLPEIVISPLAKGNAYNSTLAYTHSSDLKSMQELFGVSAPGGGFLGDANMPGTNDLFDLFLPAAGATVQGSTLYLVGGNTSDQLNVTPIGSSLTGSTGINVNGTLNNVAINQTFTGINTIYVVGFNGNDQFRFAPSLTITTIVRAGDGNDQVKLGDGNNTVNLGNGNDLVTLGDGTNVVNLGNGNNTIKAGTGNDNIEAGDGTNAIIAGALGSTGTIQVQLGNGAGNVVTLFGNGNDRVQLGDGNNDAVTIFGNGDDQVQLGNGLGDFVSLVGNGDDQIKVGDGNNDAVTVLGNGNDQVLLGNGLDDFLLLVGNGNDTVQTGDGSGVAIILGSGQKNVQLGSANWQLI